MSYRLTSGVIQLSDSDSVVAAAVGSTTVEQSTLTVMPGRYVSPELAAYSLEKNVAVSAESCA